MHVVALELRLGRGGRVGRMHVLHELVHAHGLQVGVVLVGQRRVHLVHRHGVHGRHLVLLLPLHPPVLEPDLDLAFRQAQSVGDLDPASPGQVPVKVELLLQLEGLVPGVGGALPLRLTVLIDSVCKRRVRNGRSLLELMMR